MDIIDIKELKDAVRNVFNDSVQGYKKLRGFNSREKKLWRKYKKDGTEISLRAYKDACTETTNYETALAKQGIILFSEQSWRSEVGIIKINGLSGKRQFTARIELYGDIDE